MLVVRLQRRGRKKLPLYRIVVQDSHSHPSSGKVITYLGSYNPHAKKAEFDIDKTMSYINNGAQPSERVVRLLLAQKAKLPKWVKQPDNSRTRTIRNPEKLRKNQPAEEEPATEEASSTEDSAETSDETVSTNSTAVDTEDNKDETSVEDDKEPESTKPTDSDK